jgi:hypothetical protein
MSTNFEVIFRLFFHPGEITEIRAKGLSGNKALSRNKFIDQILMNYPGVRKCMIGPEHSRIRGFAGLTVKFDL